MLAGRAHRWVVPARGRKVAMNVPAWLWVVTVVGLTAIICFDFYLVSRNPRNPSLRECTAWIGAW